LARALAALYDASGEHVKARTLLAELAPGEAPAATEAAAAPAAAEAEAARNANEVASMQADFRACYRAAVQNHADVAGRVALVLSIAADGHVSDVKANTTSLPGSAVDCLKRRAALARFEPPKGGAAVITVPVTFVKQEND
jgi:outer membrane biosynthesis protein TonB